MSTDGDFLLINFTSSSTLEMQVLFPLLKLCQALATSSHTNLTVWIIRRLEDAFAFPAREETYL